MRAVSSFAQGWMSKPGEAFVEDEAFTMAPLLIHATSGEAPGSSPTRIGAVTENDNGSVTVDVTRPTLYFSKTTTNIAGQDHDQWAYAWWNAVSATDPKVASSQGFRMTLDADGSPFLWEVLADTTGARLLFVDRALEEAASAELGPPHPGRDHTLARTHEETPDVLIVRLIESGATPLGPFAYVAEDAKDIHALLCRCMPSQVDEIVGIDEYDLLPLESLEAIGIEAGFDTSPDGVEKLLRFPAAGV